MKASESPTSEHTNDDRSIFRRRRPGAVDVALLGEVGSGDAETVGGKGANLGELIAAGFPVPDGFVVTSHAFKIIRDGTTLGGELRMLFQDAHLDDIEDLERRCADAQAMVRGCEPPTRLRDAITAAYEHLLEETRSPVIVRSSATLEDAADASFAGMNETFANVLDAPSMLAAVQACWASLFAPRSVSYRARRGFPIADADIAVVVQRYLPATRAGVMFSIDPFTGNRNHVVIESAFGGGEAVVSGSVTPDRYVYDKAHRTIVTREIRIKSTRSVDTARGGTDITASDATGSSLTDAEVAAIADLGMRVEAHYGSPQDIEWLFDPDGKPWLVQARPVTTLHDAERAPATDAAPHDVLVRGLPASRGVATGRVRILRSLADADELQDGDVLVTHMTAPDWVPLMRRAAAIVTDTGGMTCHAAIVARELDLPCIVGTGDATTALHDDQLVTVDAGRGLVIDGDTTVTKTGSATIQSTSTTSATLSTNGHEALATDLLVNLSEPSQAARVAGLDSDGVGLLRAELMIVEALDGIHPLALIRDGRREEFVDRMAAALMTFAEAFAGRPITYRTIDLRTNEFRGLVGGERYEPIEANPMIGLRGAARYAVQPELLGLELSAVARVWDAGHRNLHLMLPFVRRPDEVRACIGELRTARLWTRPGFELWIMAEVPSALVHLDAYADLGVHGISIGSNDLTQLVLGVDRDSELLRDYDETDPAVMRFVELLVRDARRIGLRTSICGEAPARHPGYVDMLVRTGIDAISVAPQALDETHRLVARAERRALLRLAREQKVLDPWEDR